MLAKTVPAHRHLPPSGMRNVTPRSEEKHKPLSLSGDERRRARGTTPFRDETIAHFADGARGNWRDPAAL
jgi:hypothetical protein